MHNGEDMGEPNHSRVMQAFESCGFAVCLQQVCPSNCGIPMTRQRVHYMGLRMAAVPDAKAQVSRMADVWSAILAGQFKQYKLEDFLDDSSAGRKTFTTSTEAQHSQRAQVAFCPPDNL